MKPPPLVVVVRSSDYYGHSPSDRPIITGIVRLELDTKSLYNRYNITHKQLKSFFFSMLSGALLLL
jgi:hypothetical protein